jgi:hypothetical protein
MTPEQLTDAELQSLRNQGNEAECAADEIVRLRAEMDALRRDAERYRWLSVRLLAADFDYNGEGVEALVFELPGNTAVSADCDATIDAAMKEAP